MVTIPATALLRDPAAAGHRAAEWAAHRRTPMWLHVDLDILDPSALPAVTYPQPGGPDFPQLSQLLRPMLSAPALIGVSVADFRPDLDPDGTAAARVAGLLTEVMAGQGFRGA